MTGEDPPQICAACHEPITDTAERLYFAVLSRDPADADAKGVLHRDCVPLLRQQRARNRLP